MKLGREFNCWVKSIWGDNDIAAEIDLALVAFGWLESCRPPRTRHGAGYGKQAVPPERAFALLLEVSYFLLALSCLPKLPALLAGG